MAQPSITEIRQAAHRAATFLFAAHKHHGLPERVPAWFVRTYGQEDEEFVVLTPDTLEERLSELPLNTAVKMSPFPLPESGLWDTEDWPEDVKTGVLLSVFGFENDEMGEPWQVFQSAINRAPTIFDGDGAIEVRGGVAVCGVNVLSHTITKDQYIDWYYKNDDKDDGIDLMTAMFGDQLGGPSYCTYYRIDASLLARAAFPVRTIPVFANRPLAALVAIADRFLAAGCDMDLYRRLGRRSERKDGQETVNWLVEGVVPAGTVTLMAGAQGTGKSTLGTELAVAVASDSGPRKWLGRQVVAENATGLAAILSGEDNIGIINARLAALDPDDTAARLMPYALDARTLPELCEALAKVPKLSLVIVDPARRYLVGDEDGSDSANTFFSTLEALASRTGAAVLVLHHLTKNAAPTSVQGVREAVRGSGVWLDRPRVMIGMFRRRETTVVGVAKHNIPPAFAMMAEGAFTRDPVTLRHLPIAKTDAADDTAAETDSLERSALAAIERLRASGTIVMRRGTAELWALKPAELDGIGRNRIRELVDALIAAGLVASNPAGLEVAA